MSKHHITQHKRFVLYGIHPDPARLRASVEILQQTGIRASRELFRMVVEMTKKCRASFTLGRYMTFCPPLKEIFLRGFRGKEKTF